MDTTKIIKIQSEIFSEIKNLWNLSEEGEKSHKILDNFLDELSMKRSKENRFIAYSRISELRVEPLELFLGKQKIEIENFNKKLGKTLPNKLKNKEQVLTKAYNYTKRIYEDLQEQFIYKLRSEKLVSDFEFELFKGVLHIGKAFNSFMPVWQQAISKQNEVLDKKFGGNSQEIMKFLREKNLLELDTYGNETDRSYSVLVGGKSLAYFEAFPGAVKEIIVSLQIFIEALGKFDTKEKQCYIDYLYAIKAAFEETDCTKLLDMWRKVDQAWMQIQGPIQISHPLEFYEDKYRKAVAPEWDLRILDTETLESKSIKNIASMYELLYENIDKQKYQESYNFSKDNFNRVQLYISEPVLYFGSELNGLFSAQVVPNDEQVSKKYGKKIFAFPKMVLENKQKAPLMKLTQAVFDSQILDTYGEILKNDRLFFDIYDIETIGHEYGHTLWLTEDSEVYMNGKTGNFKNIEEFKATSGGLVSYFMSTEEKDLEFEKNIFIVHIIRCIGLLKYREVADVLPYYNEALIHLDILLHSGILKIENNMIQLDFNEDILRNTKNEYIRVYKELIATYLDKKDAGEFLYNYVEVDNEGNTVSKDTILKDFGNYYYDLYKKIGNETV